MQEVSFINDLYTFLLDNIKVIPISAIAGFIVHRITARDQKNIDKELERFKSELNTQKDIVAKAFEHATATPSCISELHVDSLKQLWKTWMELKKCVNPFLVPYQLLKDDELNDATKVRRVFALNKSDTISSINQTLKFISDIDAVAPFIPRPIALYVKASALFYCRIVVKYLLTWYVYDRLFPWYLDTDGKKDFTVQGLLSIFPTSDLPDPSTMPNKIECFLAWNTSIENNLQRLYENFFAGDLDQKVKNLDNVTKYISEISTKNKVIITAQT